MIILTKRQTEKLGISLEKGSLNFTWNFILREYKKVV